MGIVREIPTKPSLRQTALRLATFTEAELIKASGIGRGQVRDYLRLCSIAGSRVLPNGKKVNVYRAPDARSDLEAA